jgi:hypothetical protein
MNIDVFWQWAITIIISAMGVAGGLFISLRKAGSEKQSLDASAANNWSLAAQREAERNSKIELENARLEAEMTELRQLFERKRYRVIIEFTIGDPPEPGKVVIEPIIDPPIKSITRPLQQKRR